MKSLRCAFCGVVQDSHSPSAPCTEWEADDLDFVKRAELAPVPVIPDPEWVVPFRRQIQVES